MRRVYLESPYAGNVPANVIYAIECMRDCLQRGEAGLEWGKVAVEKRWLW
jgi:hypothetical protein